MLYHKIWWPQCGPVWLTSPTSYQSMHIWSLHTKWLGRWGNIQCVYYYYYLENNFSWRTFFFILITKLWASLCDYFGILSAQPSSFVLCRWRRFSPRSLKVTEACHSDVFFTDLPWSLVKLQSAATLATASKRVERWSQPPGWTEELEHVSDLSEARRSQESHCSGTSCQVEDRMSSRGRYTWSQQSFLNPPASRIGLGFIQQHKGKWLKNVSATGSKLEVMKEAGWTGCDPQSGPIQHLCLTGVFSPHDFFWPLCIICNNRTAARLRSRTVTSDAEYFSMWQLCPDHTS